MRQRRKNRTIDRLRRLIVLACVSLGVFSVGSAWRPAAADSPNLAWAPYLQQLGATGVTIRWTTHAGANPLVRYGTDASYAEAATGSSRPLTALNTSLHQVALAGLQPDTTYYYKVIVDGEDLLPDRELTFHTAPAIGSDTPFTFLAFGDYGIPSPSQRALRDQMLRDSFGFVLALGDHAYPDAGYATFDTAVFQVYRDVFARAAIFPVLGNREYVSPGAAPYLDIFDLPGNAWRAEDRGRYYSFDYGGAHFVVLDSNAPLDGDDAAASDDMFDWLRADLSQTTQRWKIVAFHHPAYTAGPHAPDARARSKLVPILETYGVDLVLSGHDHNYQRSKPIKGGQAVPEGQGGVVYVISGGGATADSACGTADWLAFARCGQQYGLYSRIAVGAGSLTVEAVNAQGVVEDRYTLARSSATPTPTSTPAPEPTSTPAPEQTVYAADAFDRELTSGWGSADVGGAYSFLGPVQDFSVAASAGSMRLPAANATRAVRLSGAAARDVDITVRVATDKLPNGGGLIAYAVARDVGGNTEYHGRLRWAVDGRLMLVGERVVDGAITLLGGERAVPNAPQQPDSFVWLRVQVAGADPTTIRIKAWPDGQPEPAGWLYTATDGEPRLQVAGGVGLRAYLSSAALNAPARFSFDDVRVVDAGAAARQ